MDIRTELIRASEEYAAGRLEDAYRYFGCRYLPEADAWLFAVYAPAAGRVCLAGDFNGWNVAACPMERAGRAWFAVVPGVQRGQIYKYAVTGADGRTVLKSDPFAAHWETGPGTGSKVWERGGYEWGDGEYLASRSNPGVYERPMSVYEVHLGSWRIGKGETYPWYRSTADKLAQYCADMGYTHIELLPLTEFPYEPSWGYQVTGYFAPTSRYGTPQDFMYFIDTLHRAGLGVILDWVPAHFPRDEYGLACFDGTPVYERSDPDMALHPEWSTLIFDYARGEVQSLLLSSAAMLMDEYHADGLRIDAVTSMLYLDYARSSFRPNEQGGNIDLGAVSLLRRVNAMVRSRGGITAAEESTAYPLVTAPERDGGLGFTFKWDMGFMHDTLEYLAMDPVYRSGSHDKLTFSMMYAFSEHFILAFSHDEVVHGKKSLLDKMFGTYDEKFATLRALYGLQYAHPGKKLGFMGGELGQFIEWDYKTQLDWFLLAYPRHAEIQRYVRELNRFYLAHPALYERDCSWDGFEWLNVDDRGRSSIAFMRMSEEEKIVCAFNFTPCTWELRVSLPSAGVLFPLLSSDEPRFGGSGAAPAAIQSEKIEFRGAENSASLTLAPLSAAYYSFKETENGEKL